MSASGPGTTYPVPRTAARASATSGVIPAIVSFLASLDAIPGLEIEADDVRCTHGATVGQIEAEPMFYLESRGVSQPDARRLIVEGFFAPVIERIPLAETRERLIDEIGLKIG